MPIGGGFKLKSFMDANSPLNDAELYRKALEKAAYGAVGPAFSQGLQGLEGYLSRAGPLADSGARAALSARLASNLYGGAARQVAGGYADYLGQSLRARKEQQYRLALMKAQKKMQGSNFLGGIVGTGLRIGANYLLPGAGSTFGVDSMPGGSYPGGGPIYG